MLKTLQLFYLLATISIIGTASLYLAQSNLAHQVKNQQAAINGGLTLGAMDEPTRVKIESLASIAGAMPIEKDGKPLS